MKYKIYADALPNIPWAERSEGAKGPVWRSEHNPIINTRAILTMADRYLTYAEKTAKQTGDHAASVSKAYYAIADKIIGMAELMLANETAGSDNLSIQIPYYDQKLNLYDTDGNKSEDRYYPCTLKVTVYNFGETAIENATLELQNNKGRAIGTGTFSLSAGESIQVPIEIKYAGKLDTLFGTTLSTGKTVYTFLKAVAKQNGNVFAERFVEVSKDNYQIGILTEENIGSVGEMCRLKKSVHFPDDLVRKEN